MKEKEASVQLVLTLVGRRITVEVDAEDEADTLVAAHQLNEQFAVISRAAQQSDREEKLLTLALLFALEAQQAKSSGWIEDVNRELAAAESQLQRWSGGEAEAKGRRKS